MPREASLFPEPEVEEIAPGVALLRAFAVTAPLRCGIAQVAAEAPFRHLVTRGGPMSVAMTNCGECGWHSDAGGYRYVDADPETGRRWPAMPAAFRALAATAATRAGYPSFEPDCCLINRYVVGAHMGTHRDFDELEMSHPIVSASIGLPATFLWYGQSRAGKARRVPVADGDVLVWGGDARAGFHAVGRIAPPLVPPTGGADAVRFNLTFRRAR